MEVLYGKNFIDLLNVLTKENLQTLINRMGSDNPDTRLKLNLKGRDPDEGMTRIAYDKGYLLLLALENKLGRPTLDSFMLKYFKDFQFKSIDTETFIDYIDQNLLISQKSKFDIKEWIYLGGLPKNSPEFESVFAKRVNEALDLFLKKKTVDKLNTKEWSAHEWRYFVSRIPRNTTPELLEQLNREYNLAFSGNAEIRAIWLELCIYAGYFDANYTAIENFLITVGRRKFLVPLYQAMIQTDRTKEANMIYQKARPNYHAISRGTIDALLTL
jgi:leukotriene-A4 hydrolase